MGAKSDFLICNPKFWGMGWALASFQNSEWVAEFLEPQACFMAMVLGKLPFLADPF